MRPTAAERVTRKWTPAEADAVFQLENGAGMDQKTFHALYLKTPEGFKAELIGGVVYVMSSPVSLRHGMHHSRLVRWLCTYADDTPGTEIGDNTTSVLGEESEPQPDAFLIIEPECGGQTTIDKKGYVHGAPELVAEVAHTTASIDLKAKKADYERAGVKEYVVVKVREESVLWFVRQGDSFSELSAGPDGAFRSTVFPGLWLHPQAFFERPTRRLFTVLQQGLDTPEHAAFVAELAARRKKKTRPAGKKSPRKSK
jgi:Uma2 family endonuclease